MPSDDASVERGEAHHEVLSTRTHEGNPFPVAVGTSHTQ